MSAKTNSKKMMKQHATDNAIRDELKQVNLPATRTLSTSKGRTVETHLTDGEAIDHLDKMVNGGKLKDNGFASSLLRQSNGRGLSQEQIVWVHILVMSELAPRPKAAAVKKIKVDKLLRMFEAAKSHINFPMLSLVTPGTKTEVTVYRATDKSKFAGSFQITNGRGWRKAWFGRVLQTGEVTLREGVPHDVVKLVEKLAADPYTTLTENGHLSGKCCCCRKQLDDPKSVKLGLGPVCAKRWALIK